MAFCNKCGKELADDASFCTQCGSVTQSISYAQSSNQTGFVSFIQGAWGSFISVWKWENYANFKGRTRRKEYWGFVLFWYLFSLASGILVGAISLYFFALYISIAFYAVSFIPFLAISFRRLHDTDRSGWHCFFLLALPLIVATGAILFDGFIVLGSLTNNPLSLLSLSKQDRETAYKLFFVPYFVGAVVFIVFQALPGTCGHNKYGPDPKMLEKDEIGKGG